MVELRSTSFVGQPSVGAATHNVHSLNRCIAVSVSGPDAQSVMEQVVKKLKVPEVDSPSSFFYLLQRSIEQWGELYGEVAAIFTLDQKVYLMVQSGEIWLRRGDKFGKALKSSDELKVVEGQFQVGDEYLVLTQSAAVAVHELLLAVNEGRLSFQDMVLQLQNRIDSSGLSDRCAVSVVEFEGVNTIEPVVAVANTTQHFQENPVTVELPVKLPKRTVEIGKMVHRVSTKVRQFVLFAVSKTKNIRELRNQQISKQARIRIAVVLFLLVLVSVAILGFLFFKNSQLSKATAFLQPFEGKLLTLRSLSETDIVAARDQGVALQQEFESQKKSFGSNWFAKSQLDVFSQEMVRFVDDVSGKVELQTLPIFYDFRLVQADFIATNADIDQNKAVFLDKERQVAIALTLDTKQQTVLPIGQYSVLKDISFVNEHLDLLADGVYSFPIDSQKEAQKIIPEGDSNREGVWIRAYDDFIYVFNAEKRNIYRYFLSSEAKDEQAPVPIGWFQDKKDLDFSAISSIAVDGDVWLGTTEGKILRYERGNKVEFSLSGMQDQFSSSLKIYTKPNMDSIFVLESKKNRVVRLSKDGAFIRQIESPSLGAATDVIFSPVTNKAYALVGSLVYELQL